MFTEIICGRSAHAYLCTLAKIHTQEVTIMNVILAHMHFCHE